MNEPVNSSHKPLGTSSVDPATRNWQYESRWLGLWRGEVLFVSASLEIISRRLIATESPFVRIESEFERDDVRKYRLAVGESAVTLIICRMADKSTIQMQIAPGWDAKTSSGDLTASADLIHNFVAGSLWWSEEETKVNRQPVQTSIPPIVVNQVFQSGQVNIFSGHDTQVDDDIVGADKRTAND
jgi:hypothetical protein